MKTLGLLRHAKSEWDDLSKRDFDRGLNERGRAGARLVGRHIAAHGVAWDLVLASPAERVRRTLAAALPDMQPHFEERLYLASAETIFDVVRETAADEGAILLVGHNPGLQEALFALVPPAAEDRLFDEAASKYPTATFAVFELDIDGWADLAPGCGKLVHFTRPRDLDPALGPEAA